MKPDSFARNGMDIKLAINEGNTLSSFRNRDEKKALKKAKEARRSFRESNGYEVETIWKRLIYLLSKYK